MSATMVASLATNSSERAGSAVASDRAASGRMARANPSFCASFSLAPVCATGRPGRAEIALGKEQLGWIGDFLQAPARHLEYPDLIRGAKAILEGAQNTKLLRAFALEGKHCVDHVLDHARARDLTVLSDMPNEDDGRARVLRETDQNLGARAYLRDGAGCGFDRIGPHGLD